MKNKRTIIKAVGIGVGVFLFWMMVWEGLSVLVGQELLLPSPLQVVKTLWALWKTATFWKSIGWSFLRIVGGFAAGMVIGSLLAVVTHRFSVVDRLLSPLVRIVRAAPVASFILLAYVWIRVRILPGFIACLMVIPPVWDNVRQGIGATDPRLLEMAAVFRLPKRKVLRDIRLPSLRPFLETAAVTGLGLAWKSGIAAEVICCPPDAIGTHLHDAKAYLETPAVFAWTATVVLLSVALERLLRRVMNRQKGDAV